MVLSVQYSSHTVEDNLENVPEEKTTDTESIDTLKMNTENELPPSDLERLKTFTHKVARCAAKSFCETYVRPLVINNPKPLPCKSEAINIHRQEDHLDTTLNPAEDQAETDDPKQENKENEVTSVQNQRRDMEEEMYRKAAVVNPIKTEDPIAATVNLLQENGMVTLNKEKPSLSFDIANILSYIPCKSLYASCDQKDENNEDLNELKATEEIESFDINSNGSQSSTLKKTKGDEDTNDNKEEASPLKEEWE